MMEKLKPQHQTYSFTLKNGETIQLNIRPLKYKELLEIEKYKEKDTTRFSKICLSCCQELENENIEELDAFITTQIIKKVFELSVLSDEEVKQNPL